MNGSPTLRNTLEPWRIWAFVIAIAVVFIVYIGRLFILQVVEQVVWQLKADENRTQDINLPAARGIIYDRNGFILAQNIPSYNIVITQANLPDDPGEVQEIFRELSALTGVPVNRNAITDATPFVPCKSDHGIAQIVEYGQTSTPFTPVPIKCNVDRNLALIVEQKSIDWPGVGVEIVPVRDYPTGELTASVIGYLGPIPLETKAYYEAKNLVTNRDKIGYAGIERYFQTWLAGQNGMRTVERDVGGQVLRDIVEPISPTPGYNIELTIDTRLQQATEAILLDEINSWNRVVASPDKLMTSGVVIAINPKTGEILSMVSYPTYENNRMAREISAYYYEQLAADQRNPLLNHAVGDRLPVGSVFKLATATGVLNEGVVNLDTIIKTPGVLTIQEKYYANDPGRSKEFVDWIRTQKPEGFVQLDILHCIAFSSNVCFYKLGGGYENEIPQGLGICRLGSYARALGYGDSPDIQLPDRIGGLIPDPKWKRINQGQSWSIGDTYISSVGQGYVIGTPLQVLLSAATIANDGKLMEPTILHRVLNSEGNVITDTQPVMRWDLTVDPRIQEFNLDSPRDCEPTGNMKTIQPWVFDAVKQGMHLATTVGTLGDLAKNLLGFDKLPVAVAGKTGTAEYCDKFVFAKGLCVPGSWPTHAWTVVFGPYEDPEIAVVAFVYNGGEGASVAGPIVRRVLQAYFDLKAVDATTGNP